MQWIRDFLNWLQTTDGHRSIFLAAIVLVAVVLGTLIAGAAVRASIAKLVARQERDLKNAAIATLVDAATEASVWNSLTPAEQVLNDRAVGQADIALRLLPVKGSGVAATWAAHELASLKRNSATFGYQLEPAVAEFRDRLVEWLHKPGRARKSFVTDLERWKYAESESDSSLVAKQDSWVAEQHHERFAKPADTAAAGSAAVAAPGAAAGTAPVGAPAASTSAAAAPAAAAATPFAAAPEVAETPAPAVDPVAPVAPVVAPNTDASGRFDGSRSVTAGGAEPSTATAQTQQLLADVEALEVRQASEPRSVEEFPPLPASEAVNSAANQAASSGDRDGDRPVSTPAGAGSAPTADPGVRADEGLGSDTDVEPDAVDTWYELRESDRSTEHGGDEPAAR